MDLSASFNVSSFLFASLMQISAFADKICVLRTEKPVVRKSAQALSAHEDL
jgi:hypothetical protein